jgi:hypothetical protein
VPGIHLSKILYQLNFPKNLAFSSELSFPDDYCFFPILFENDKLPCLFFPGLKIRGRLNSGSELNFSDPGPDQKQPVR